MTKTASSKSSKLPKAVKNTVVRAAGVDATSLSGTVKLPYRPKSFTVQQLRNAIAELKK